MRIKACDLSSGKFEMELNTIRGVRTAVQFCIQLEIAQYAELEQHNTKSWIWAVRYIYYNTSMGQPIRIKDSSLLEDKIRWEVLINIQLSISDVLDPLSSCYQHESISAFIPSSVSARPSQPTLSVLSLHLSWSVGNDRLQGSHQGMSRSWWS